MDKRLKNRFDVQVVFPDFAFGITNRNDVALTPEDVAQALEDFIARIRRGGHVAPQTDDAVATPTE